MRPPLVFRHDGLLGTVVEVHLTATAWRDGDGIGEVDGVGPDDVGPDDVGPDDVGPDDVGPDEEIEAALDRADEAVHAEIVRLQGILNARDPDSALRRWGRGELDAPAELVEVLDLAETWRNRSGGAFDPRVGLLVERWNEAAARNHVPTATEQAGWSAEVARAGPDAVDLSGIAKGWIAERAAATGLAQPGVASVVVNAGGDLVHRGSGAILVGIEDPARPYDNVPPLAAVRLADGALATSGTARRGWRIGDRWFPHTLDPRTGSPVARVASASVRAPDAVTAEVLATVLTVLGPEEGPGRVDGFGAADVAWLVVSADGHVIRSPSWPTH